MSIHRALPSLPPSWTSSLCGAAVVLSVAALPGRASGAPDSTPGPSVQDVIDGVESTYKDVQSLQADFHQVVRSAAMGAGPAQEGVVTLARPRQMRWEFQVPDRKLFVTDGKTIWVYTPADNQVFISEDLSGGDGGTEQLLENLDSLDELFDVQLLPGAPEGSVKLSLTPKQDARFKKLQLQLSTDGYRLQELVVVDSFDNETVLTFSNLRVNPELPPSVFHFEVPDGATVVRSDGP